MKREKERETSNNNEKRIEKKEKYKKERLYKHYVLFFSLKSFVFFLKKL